MNREAETPLPQTLRYRRGDLEQFARASGDINPLHAAPGYAHRTAYGEPVAYGVLGALSALAAISLQAGARLQQLTADFPGPLFAEQDYAVEVEQRKPLAAKVRIRDGRRTLLRLSARYFLQEPQAAAIDEWPEFPTRPRAAFLADEQLLEGLAVEGNYGPPASALEELWRRFQLDAHGVSQLQTAALLWCSYLIGMELPGERALFSKLQLAFPARAARVQGPLNYTARLSSNERRFGLLSIDAQLSAAASPIAIATLSAFARRPVATPKISPAAPIDLKDQTIDPDLKGRVALVIGASRGLGAALSRALASRGCTVLGSFRRSSEEADALAAELNRGPGSFAPLQGDASLARVCQSFRAEIEKTYGGLDYLICNACPPLRPLWIEPASQDRLLAHVAESLALVASPLCQLAGLIEKRQGGVAVISSSYVEELPPEWPHYITAKFAIEGLARSAASEFPNMRVVIARPPALDTDLGNTPLSEGDKLAPATAAAAILSALLNAKPDDPRPLFADFSKGSHAIR